MNPSANSSSGGTFPRQSEDRIDQRVFRTMTLAVALSVLASLPFANWRVTIGLLLGGGLSLLNHYWLRSSVAAAFNRAFGSQRPRLSIANYVLRYFIVGMVIFVCYKLDLISLVATIAGLCSFVIALFAEAVREVYFAIIHREETT